MVAAGADIIDVGGQSTRPGARAISAGQELKRILPVIRCALRPNKIINSIHFSLSYIKNIKSEKKTKERGQIRIPYVLLHVTGIPGCAM